MKQRDFGWHWTCRNCGLEVEDEDIRKRKGRIPRRDHGRER